eukprot:3382010-Rhodomonas_salina.1
MALLCDVRYGPRPGGLCTCAARCSVHCPMACGPPTPALCGVRYWRRARAVLTEGTCGHRPCQGPLSAGRSVQ